MRYVILRLAGTAPLVLLSERLDPYPFTSLVKTLDLKIPDYARSDQIFFEFTAPQGMLAEGTGVLDEGPLLDADVAEGVPE